MIWERGGTIDVVNGSATLAGTGTTWATAAVLAGYGVILPDLKWYEIEAVNGSTEITLATPYDGPSASAQTYVIVPTSGANEKIHADIQEFLAFARSRVETLDAGLADLQSDYDAWKVERTDEVDALIVAKGTAADDMIAAKAAAADQVIADKSGDFDAVIVSAGDAANLLLTTKTDELNSFRDSKTIELDDLVTNKGAAADQMISDKSGVFDQAISDKSSAADTMISGKAAEADTMLAEKADALNAIGADGFAHVVANQASIMRMQWGLNEAFYDKHGHYPGDNS